MLHDASHEQLAQPAAAVGGINHYVTDPGECDPVADDSGKADLLGPGRTELDQISGAIVELEKKIPADIPWVIRVDGHTDVRPITGGPYKSNWQLSAERAIAVVQYLIAKGVSPQHLVAAGFGEFQPIDTAKTEEAYKRNRRIEFKLTER